MKYDLPRITTLDLTWNSDGQENSDTVAETVRDRQVGKYNKWKE